MDSLAAEALFACPSKVVRKATIGRDFFTTGTFPGPFFLCVVDAPIVFSDTKPIPVVLRKCGAHSAKVRAPLGLKICSGTVHLHAADQHVVLWWGDGSEGNRGSDRNANSFAPPGRPV